ncbi:SDR family oxidoreductase [Williamsia sp. CHRR-6]|uniref:SDR family oxidoreductase n=1 Tax=Williamsia sp. CHRR-6 TaxID=2835871 RepID=UPI001BD9CF17|nr:SDR family oxidoreductase [Williamsia sp. CHRR-6]MBT0566540.1 SDR family oxidoreductase [Williamsia sp. CHRR-6]
MTRQRILITGASSGLGEGMARTYAREGRALALCARRVDRLDALATELGASAQQVVTSALDVTDVDTVAPVFDDLAAGLGGLDRVIVNAGSGAGAVLGTGGLHHNIDTVTTNLVGALAQIEAAMAIFRAQQSGHLVLVASIAGVRGLPKAQAAYSASKAGLISLGQSLQTELAHSPIRVTILLPGYIETAINAGVQTKLKVDRDRGVAALVAAIEREPARASVPWWPWTLVGTALRLLPAPVVRKIV